MSTLLLVRHARAMPLGDRRLPGPDVALVPDGVDEAGIVAERSRDFEPEAVYTSDALRSRQTGEIIAAANEVPLRVIPALRELDFGAWAGRTFAEVVTDDPAASAWFANPDLGAPPGGEPIAAAANRVLRVLRTIADDHVGYVAVVGHSGSLRLAVAKGLGMPLSSYWRLRLECASLSIVTWAAEAPVLETWNDTGHLEREYTRRDGSTPDSDANP